MSVTWLDAPGSAIGRNDTIDFTVSGGTSGSSTLPTLSDPATHLAATTWTQIYSVDFTTLASTTLVDSAGAYDWHLAVDQNVTIAGKTWSLHAPRRGSLTQILYGGGAGLQISGNATAVWPLGPMDAPHLWIDAQAQLGWDPTKPLLALGRFPANYWPGHRARFGLGIFQRNIQASHTGVAWTGNGDNPYDTWTYSNAIGVRVASIGPELSDVSYSAALDSNLYYNGSAPYTIGCVHDHLTGGYGLASATPGSGTMPVADPKTLTAFGRVRTPSAAAGAYGIGIFSSMDGANADDGNRRWGQCLGLRVFQGGA